MEESFLCLFNWLLMEVTTWGGGQSILDERQAVSWCFLMTMAVMCQRVSEEEEAKGTGVGPEAERHSRKGRWMGVG